MTEKGRKIMNMVLAFLVAVGAWVFVVYNYEPMTDITYSEVPVTLSGGDALAERGLAVSDTDISGVTVTLNQKRIDAGRIDREDIKVSADISNCVAGDNRLDLSISGPDGTSVIKADKHTVDVSVGRAKSAVMDIKVRYDEPGEDDAEPVYLDLSSEQAEVICTQDRLSSIGTIAALLDYEEVGDSVKSYTADLVALNREGEVLSHVVIRPDEISLDACAGFTKEVSLSIPVKNPSDDGYERKYVAPETLVIKGSREAIDKIGTVRAAEIDLSGVYENTELPIEYNLPEGIYVADGSKGQTVRVSVSEKKQDEDEDEDGDDS